MKYDQIVKLFETEEGMTELLNTLKTDFFDTIDDYASQFVADALSPDELKQTKTVLTGMVASLQPIYSKALSLKKQKEYRYYAQKKSDCEASGTKFVDGATEKEAKDAVRLYRDIRDLLCGYILASNSLIYDIKDRTESNRKEYGNIEK